MKGKNTKFVCLCCETAHDLAEEHIRYVACWGDRYTILPPFLQRNGFFLCDWCLNTLRVKIYRFNAIIKTKATGRPIESFRFAWPGKTYQHAMRKGLATLERLSAAPWRLGPDITVPPDVEYFRFVPMDRRDAEGCYPERVSAMAAWPRDWNL